MKKNLFTVIAVAGILALCSLTASAQQAVAAASAGAVSFDNSSLVVQAGIGLGGYAYSNATGLPLLNVSFEKGIGERVGPGSIGVGGYAGFKTSMYKFGAGYHWTYTDILIAARGAYHPDFAQTEQLDAYAGVAAGINLYTFDSNDQVLDSDSRVNILYGFYIGARYYLSGNIGVYGELGYGLGYLNVGAVFKLK